MPPVFPTLPLSGWFPLPDWELLDPLRDEFWSRGAPLRDEL